MQTPEQVNKHLSEHLSRRECNLVGWSPLQIHTTTLHSLKMYGLEEIIANYNFSKMN